MPSRIRQLLRHLHARSLDAYLVFDPVNIQYLTGYPAADAWLVVTPSQCVYLTDARYTDEVRKFLKGVQVREWKGSLPKAVGSLFLKKSVRMGFDARQCSLQLFRQLKKELPKTVRLAPANGLVEDLRMIKDAKEIQAVRGALRVHHDCLKYLRRIAKPGVTEAWLLNRLECYVKDRGGRFAFDPIIASGANSSLPHARVTGRKIRASDILLIDMGIDKDGYKSDLTRVFFFGKISPLIRKTYEHVAEAQHRAIEAIRQGVEGRAVDEQARNYLEEKKLAKYFTHALGHGVGLDIHEEPRLSQNCSITLQEGMIITVEPAVYRPRRFGIRLEEMVLVQKQGCEVLSRGILP